LTLEILKANMTGDKQLFHPASRKFLGKKADSTSSVLTS